MNVEEIVGQLSEAQRAELIRLTPVIEAAVMAKEKLADLRSNAEWRSKYLNGDRVVVREYESLLAQVAAGMDIGSNLTHGMNSEAARGGPGAPVSVGVNSFEAHGEKLQTLVHDPDFRARYLAGDVEAVARWNEMTALGEQAIEAGGSDTLGGSTEGNAA